MDIKNKKVLVVGMGKSGMASVKVLHNLGAKVVATDMKTEEFIDKTFVKYLKKEKIPFHFGGDPSTDDIEMIALSPGVPPSLPFVESAKRNGVEIVGELELAYRVGKGTYIAITGTNGKTTTVTLVGDIVKNSGAKCLVVGNIGIAAIDKTIDADDDTVVVTEVSSFQLETTDEFHPHVSAILNITEDHMDRHGNMEAYSDAKAKIFERQTKEDYTVVNFDDKLALNLTTKSKATIVPFSAKEEMMFGVCVKNDQIIVIDSDEQTTEICGVDELKIPGEHNLENALAATAICFFAGIDPEVIGKTLREFEGVEHRLEMVDEIGGVRYINDSKGTNPDASIKAIEAMKGNTIIIAGGYDKDSDFTEFVEAFNGKVTHAILIGATAVKIKGVAEKLGFTNTLIVTDMEQAVEEAARLAKPGDSVLLSPACASWDMYTSFEERGAHFKECVSTLKK